MDKSRISDEWRAWLDADPACKGWETSGKQVARQHAAARLSAQGLKPKQISHALDMPEFLVNSVLAMPALKKEPLILAVPELSVAEPIVVEEAPVIISEPELPAPSAPPVEAQPVDIFEVKKQAEALRKAIEKSGMPFLPRAVVLTVLGHAKEFEDTPIDFAAAVQFAQNPKVIGVIPWRLYNDQRAVQQLLTLAQYCFGCKLGDGLDVLSEPAEWRKTLKDMATSFETAARNQSAPVLNLWQAAIQGFVHYTKRISAGLPVSLAADLPSDKTEKTRKEPKQKVFNADTVRQLVQEGRTLGEIAEALKTSYKTLKKNWPDGVDKPQPPAKAEKPVKGKRTGPIPELSAEKIAEIQAKARDGMTMLAIAAACKVSKASVSKYWPEGLTKKQRGYTSKKFDAETVRQHVLDGKSILEIAKALETTFGTLRKRWPDGVDAPKRKIPVAKGKRKSSPRPLDPELLKKVDALARAGKSKNQISKALGFSIDKVTRYWPADVKTIKQDNQRKVFAAETVRPLVEAGNNLKEIAKALKTTQGTLSKNWPEGVITPKEWTAELIEKGLMLKPKNVADAKAIADIAARAKTGESQKNIAKALGLTVETVAQHWPSDVPKKRPGYNKKTIDVEKLKALLAENKSVQEIIEILEISYKTLTKNWPTEVPYPTRTKKEKPIRPSFDTDKLYELASSGMTIAGIAEAMGVNYRVIGKKWPLDIPKPVPVRPEPAPRANKTVIDATTLKELCGIHHTMKALAKALGISLPTLRMHWPAGVDKPKREPKEPPASPPPVDTKKLHELAASGMTVAAVAQEMGVHASVIGRRWPTDIPKPVLVRPETAPKQATSIDVDRLKELLPIHRTMSALAKALGMSCLTLEKHWPAGVDKPKIEPNKKRAEPAGNLVQSKPVDALEKPTALAVTEKKQAPAVKRGRGSGKKVSGKGASGGRLGHGALSTGATRESRMATLSLHGRRSDLTIPTGKRAYASGYEADIREDTSGGDAYHNIAKDIGAVFERAGTNRVARAVCEQFNLRAEYALVLRSEINLSLQSGGTKGENRATKDELKAGWERLDKALAVAGLGLPEDEPAQFLDALIDALSERQRAFDTEKASARKKKDDVPVMATQASLVVDKSQLSASLARLFKTAVQSTKAQALYGAKTWSQTVAHAATLKETLNASAHPTRRAVDAKAGAVVSDAAAVPLPELRLDQP